MKRARNDEEFPDLARNLFYVPVDVIEKHIVPYLTVLEFRYMCRVDKRVASLCQKMGDRVWKMFVQRDFPQLASPNKLCLADPAPNKCTYFLYERQTFKLPDGEYAFFSFRPKNIHDVWNRFAWNRPRRGYDDIVWSYRNVVWLLDPVTRRITNFGVSDPEQRMLGVIENSLTRGLLGFVGFVRPDGSIVQTQQFHDKSVGVFDHLLGLERKRKELVRLIEKRARLDGEIAALTAEINAPF